MKEIFIAMLVMAGIWKLALMYEAMSDVRRVAVNRRFVELTETQPSPFFSEVESAVGQCVELGDMPTNLSQKVRRLTGKIVAKIMTEKDTRNKDEDILPRIKLWFIDQLKAEFTGLSENDIDLLIKKLTPITASYDITACIVSTSVGHHDQGSI